LQKADRQRWNEILKIPKDCEERFDSTSSHDDYAGLAFDQVSGDKSLVSVECYPGAYQPGIILYLLKEDSVRTATLLRLDGIEEDADDDGKALPYQMFDGLVNYRPKTSTLEILQKHRGLGDCGRFLRYHFTNGGFTLFETREQECRTDGRVGSTDVDRWPIKRNP